MTIKQSSELDNLRDLLEFEDDKPFKIAESIIDKLGDIDIKISRTGDNEILIFREFNKCFYNILVDDDSDISYLFIGDNRSESYTHIWDDSSDKSIDEVINEFNKNR